MANALPFIDLATQRDRIRDRVDAAIACVLDHGAFIMGPEIARFEEALSGFAGLKHALSCSNGTDALVMPMMAWGIGPGDAVFVPSFTFAATAEVVAWLGATPIFVDVEAESFNLSVESLRLALDDVLARGALRPRAVIAVDLFGLPANYPAIAALCAQHGLKLISDAAQGFGATLDGHQAGHWADVVCTSFFPAKPLGCYGDGGAVLTTDDALAEAMRSIRIHGQGSDRYDNVRIGLNARMDTLQAAILIEKLAIFPEEIVARNRVADRYRRALSGTVATPGAPANMVSTWAQYTIRLPGHDRAAVAASLREAGVPTAIYYPKPLHQQTAYRDFPIAPGGTPVSEALAQDVLSLPMHPYLSESDQDRVVDALREAVQGAKAA